MKQVIRIKDESGASIISVLVALLLIVFISATMWKNFVRNGRVQLGAKSSTLYGDLYDGFTDTVVKRFTKELSAAEQSCPDLKLIFAKKSKIGASVVLGKPKLSATHPLMKLANKKCRTIIKDGEYQFCTYMQPAASDSLLKGDSMLKTNENFTWVNVKLKNLTNNADINCRLFATNGPTPGTSHCNRYQPNPGMQPGLQISYIIHWLHRHDAKRSTIKTKKGQFYAAKQCGV